MKEQISLCCTIVQKDHWPVSPDKLGEDEVVPPLTRLFDLGKVTFLLWFVSSPVK